MLCVLFLCLLSVVAASDYSSGKAPTIKLNDGALMPTLGLGTFLGFDSNGQKPAEEREVVDAVKWAYDSGYRMLDTASAYHNEQQIGQAIAEGVDRDDMFIVTKLGSHEQRDVVKALKGSLSRLNVSYVDLYLIHNPVAFKSEDMSEFDVIDYLDTWKGMEEAQKLGLTKSIGISNFNISQIQRLIDNSIVKPAVLQVEVNLNLAQEKLLKYCKDQNIAVMAYTPFGSLFEKSTTPPPPRVDHPTLVKMAAKYKKSAAQIALRYLTQRGVIPIPKSVNKARIEQNIDIFDFELSQEEMDTLATFNKDYRVVWPSFWQDHPFYPFEKTDKPEKNIFLSNKENKN